MVDKEFESDEQFDAEFNKWEQEQLDILNKKFGKKINQKVASMLSPSDRAKFHKYIALENELNQKVSINVRTDTVPFFANIVVYPNNPKRTKEDTVWES